MSVEKSSDALQEVLYVAREKPSGWKELFETPLYASSLNGLRPFPKGSRLWDLVAQYLWPNEMVILVYAGGFFKEFINDEHTIFRYVFCNPDLSMTLRDPVWQKEPVGVFLGNFSPDVVIHFATKDYEIVSNDFVEKFPNSSSKICNSYDKAFEMLWNLTQQATELWNQVGYYAVLSFTCRSSTDPCLYDSAELARLVAAFNTRPDLPGIAPCISSIVDSVTERFSERFGVPTPLLALFILVQCDEGLSCIMPLYNHYISALRAGKNATSWYIIDVVDSTEKQYNQALKAEQVPEAIIELTTLALESGTDVAIDHMMSLMIELNLSAAQLPVEYIVFRSRITPMRSAQLVAGFIKLADVPPERFLAAALTHPASTHPYVLYRDQMARVMTIYSLIQHTTDEWKKNTLVDQAYDTNPEWASKIVLAWTGYEKDTVTALDALMLAEKENHGILLQLAIVMVNNAPNRLEIISSQRKTIHALLLRAIKSAKRKEWKRVVLELGKWIENPFESFLAAGFKPKVVVKGRRRSARIVLIPSPLTALIVYNQHDLIEPFCRNMTPVRSFDKGLRIYLCKENLHHVIPLLARSMGIQTFSIDELADMCDNCSQDTARGLIDEFIGENSLADLLAKVLHNKQSQEACLTLMRRRGLTSREIVNAVLRSLDYSPKKRLLELAEKLYQREFKATELYQAFYENNLEDLEELLELYSPLMTLTMPDEIWQLFPTVWSNIPLANKTYESPPANLVTSAIRYRRQEVVELLIETFPRMVDLCCQNDKNLICEACWLSQTSIAQRLINLCSKVDQEHIQNSVLKNHYEELVFPQ